MAEVEDYRDAFATYRGDGVRRSAIGGHPASADYRNTLEDPAGYRPSPEARDAVNVALMMNLPLLVSGEPGSGKTQLGYAVAHELGLDRPSQFVTKSDSQARDLFYSYDAIRHFHASQTGGAPSARPFLELRALGEAILKALPPEDRFLPIRGEDTSAPPRRCVVIVDEIDKAPRDFPNDLLYEFEHLRFRIPEYGNVETKPIDDAYRPILIITSNAEQMLPQAFLRRCAFVNLEAPRGAELAALIEQRFRGVLTTEHRLVRDIVDLSDHLRRSGQIEFVPSSAELLQFTAAITMAGGDPARGLYGQVTSIEPYVSLIAKSAADQGRIFDQIRSLAAR
jgi:MoxR-like ATPase